ncbi:DegT/DnrJ/EryC1/StrS family aminotransferase [Candidatus Parcubacteria bacterium]|nr:DegT/DnrJ/EryC1/StrS family aminotransferase [Candidatus Parcubacteria bacterium]
MNKFIKRLIARIKLFFYQFYRVPYCVPAWGWAEHWAIIKCLLTGCIIKGQDSKKLYNLVRQKTGMKHVFGFNSGQEAITAVLKAWGICSKDRVIMPSYCCETVARAVIAAGVQPLFCDIDENYNPDVNHIMAILDQTVRAIIFPHLFGNPGAIDKLELALDEKGIRSQILLIDDAAQSFGARLNGRLIGTFGNAGIISFGPGKTMTASGGGILITNSERLAKKTDRLTVEHISSLNKLTRLFYWIIFRRWRRFTLPFYPFFSPVFKTKPKKQDGIYALCNVDAAIAVLQLKKLNKIIEIRIQRKEILDSLFSNYSDSFFLLPQNNSKSNSLNVATKYLIRYRRKISNDDIQVQFKDILSSVGIEIQNLYIPIHHKPEYASASNKLDKTEGYYRKLLQIPIEPSMSLKEFIFTIKTCLKAVKHLYQTSLIPDFEYTDKAFTDSFKHFKSV